MFEINYTTRTLKFKIIRTCIIRVRATTTAAKPRRPKRSDALRNIEAILEAATTCLARDPDASVNSIAQAAGVGRVTLYGHFESRRR